MDISPLADGDFVLLYGLSLERSTSGPGPMDEHTGNQVSRLLLSSKEG